MTLALTRTEVRRRVVDTLGTFAGVGDAPDPRPWRESGIPYDVLLEHAGEADLVNTFAVKVAGTRSGRDRQRADVGTQANTDVLVRYVVELRAPPDQVADQDKADDLGHALLKFLFPVVSRSRGLTLVFDGFDVPTIDPAEGRWFVGGLRFVASHRLALE